MTAAIGRARSCPDLLRELLERRDLDQAARSALVSGQQTLTHVRQIDDDNAGWLTTIIDAVGWPGRTLVGDEGAHAAWLLAQHADRHPSLQRRCLKLLETAVGAGDASPTDLAYLTDRVLLASGASQIYGTQMTTQDGRFSACRLRDPESVDDRRAAAGLGTLAAQLHEAHARNGPPAPSSMLCPNCGGAIAVWLPEIGGRSSVKCPSCGSVMTVRAHIPETRSSPASSSAGGSPRK
jgi:predicted Zn finger-like uncharacterized protein